MLQARGPGISGMSLSMTMQLMPMLEEMVNLSMPIFRNKTVIILMTLVMVFEDESDKSVTQLKNQLLSLLQGFLKKQTKNNLYFDMESVTECIKSLKRMYKKM